MQVNCAEFEDRVSLSCGSAKPEFLSPRSKRRKRRTAAQELTVLIKDLSARHGGGCLLILRDKARIFKNAFGSHLTWKERVDLRFLRLLYSQEKPYSSGPGDDSHYHPLRDQPFAADGNLYPPNSKLRPVLPNDEDLFVEVPRDVYYDPAVPGCWRPSVEKSKFEQPASHSSASRGLKRDITAWRYAGRCLREARGISSPFAGRRPTPARFKMVSALATLARAARPAM